MLFGLRVWGLGFRVEGSGFVKASSSSDIPGSKSELIR